MTTLAFAMSAELMLFAMIMVYGLLQLIAWAAAFARADSRLADNASALEQEIHDSEHDIHLP